MTDTTGHQFTRETNCQTECARCGCREWAPNATETCRMVGRTSYTGDQLHPDMPGIVAIVRTTEGRYKVDTEFGTVTLGKGHTLTLPSPTL